MAQADLDAMVTAKNEAPKTAFDNIGEWGESPNDVANRNAAAAAGVKDAAFINYDVALDAYAAREDVEPLAEKNSRDMPADFAEASFMRTVDGNTGSGSSA